MLISTTQISDVEKEELTVYVVKFMRLLSPTSTSIMYSNEEGAMQAVIQMQQKEQELRAHAYSVAYSLATATSIVAESQRVVLAIELLEGAIIKYYEN